MCHNCHVSQLSTNYDLKSDTYNTVWAEPGINCETCHGPAAEHIKVFEEAPKGMLPEDMKIIRWKTFTGEQKNDACSPCHAKTRPITASFVPGERYFDHFDLVTLEDLDFYPDGRDLGENFTLTLWRMSPCVKSGKLDCIHCHTSSGRYRFKQEETANNACLPCHAERVRNAPEPGQQMRILPHAQDRLRFYAPKRPFHASSDSHGDDPFAIPQRLQPLPQGPGCSMGR
jgi:hypothetical protein